MLVYMDWSVAAEDAAGSLAAVVVEAEDVAAIVAEVVAAAIVRVADQLVVRLVVWGDHEVEVVGN